MRAACCGFAHRSTRDYLAADELRGESGSQFLIDRAAATEWRLVIQIFAASLRQGEVPDYRSWVTASESSARTTARTPR
ncbi:MAG TPA: hypothetical protein VFQ44_05720 [Streptosporangiaceae bacterium]|nr:hypothetical protein [Streptosporangiaceae bacterium]